MHGRTIVALDWVFDFGKYRGQTIEYVIETDIDYIEWLDEKKVISFGGNVLEAIEAAQLDDSENEMHMFACGWHDMYGSPD